VHSITEQNESENNYIHRVSFLLQQKGQSATLSGIHLPARTTGFDIIPWLNMLAFAWHREIQAKWPEAEEEK